MPRLLLVSDKNDYKGINMTPACHIKKNNLCKKAKFLPLFICYARYTSSYICVKLKESLGIYSNFKRRNLCLNSKEAF
jgi:hypothetical protein